MSEWSSRTRVADAIFAVFAVLVFSASILPLASVGYFESSVLAAILALVGAGFCFPDVGRTAIPPARPAWAARLFGLLLLLWAVLQLVPVQSFWHIPLALRFRGPADLYARVASHSPFPLPIAVDLHASVHHLLLFLAFVLFAAASSRRLFRRKPRFLFLSLLIAAISLEALYGILFRDPLTPRVHGHFANADAFAGLVAMGTAVTLGMLLAICTHEGPRGTRSLARFLSGRFAAGAPLLVAAALLVQWGAIFVSGSRGAAVSALLGTAVLLVAAAIGRPALRRALWFTLPAVIALAALFQFNALRQNVLDRVQNSADVPAMVIPRLTVWQAAVRLAADFPSGTGLGGTEQILSHYQDPAVHGRVALNFAHNDSLQFLGDLGFPGAALLVCLLGFLGVRAVRACRPPVNPISRLNASPWLLRGVVAAVAVALLHAQVEFNLSARPPIQLLFLVLCALIVAAGRPRRADTGAPSRLRLPSAIVIATVALAVSAASLSTAAAYRLARAAANAAEVFPPPTDSPALAPAPVPLDDAPSALARAARLDPLSPLVPETLAQVELAAQRVDLQNAAATLAPDDPDNPTTLARIAPIFRPEEIRRIRNALSAASAAVAAAPWSPSPLTLRAWILLRGSAIGAFPDDVSQAALDDLQLAMALSPAETFVLQNAAEAFLFFAAKSDADLERLFSIGTRIITLNPALTDSVLSLWWFAGAPLSRIFALEHLPIRCLWNLYRLAESSDFDTRAAILDRIEAALSDPVLFPPPQPDSPWLPPPSSASSPAARTAARVRLASERLRLAAATGDLPAIAASAPSRAAIRAENAALRLSRAADPAYSRPIQLANIRRLFDSRTLPFDSQLDCAVQLAADNPRDLLVLSTLRDAAALGLLSTNHLDALSVLPIPPKFDRSPAPAVAPAPDSSLDIPYLGGAVILDALSIDPAPPATLSATFRFRSTSLPSALSASFLLRDPDGRHIATRSATFESNWPSYNHGSPDLALPCTLTLPLPPAARFASTLQLTLYRSHTSTIPPDDTRSPLLFSALPLFASPSPEPQPELASESESKAEPEPESTTTAAEESPSQPPQPAQLSQPESSPEEPPPPPHKKSRKHRKHKSDHATESLPPESPEPSETPEPSEPPAPQEPPAIQESPEPQEIPEILEIPEPPQSSEPPAEPPPIDPDLAAALVDTTDPSLDAELDALLLESLSLVDDTPLTDDIFAPNP